MDMVKRDLAHVSAILGILAAALASLAIIDGKTGVVRDVGSRLFRWLVG